MFAYKTPINALCLSQKLHQENAYKLLQFNELHFDGFIPYDESSDSDDEDAHGDSARLDRAINDLAFFLSHTPADVIARSAVVIEASMIEYIPEPMLRLFKLVRDTPDPLTRLRVIDPNWTLYSSSKRTAKRFVACARAIDAFLKGEMFAGFERKWRAYPLPPWSRDCHALSTHLSAEDCQFARDCIDNGI